MKTGFARGLRMQEGEAGVAAADVGGGRAAVFAIRRRVIVPLRGGMSRVAGTQPVADVLHDLDGARYQSENQGEGAEFGDPIGVSRTHRRNDRISCR